MKKKLKSFKIAPGAAMNAIENISKTTYRNITNSLEYLVIKGYEQHLEEKIKYGTTEKKEAPNENMR